ncbi:hypothetical protein D3C86_1891750 [compost metagenome]
MNAPQNTPQLRRRGRRKRSANGASAGQARVPITKLKSVPAKTSCGWWEPRRSAGANDASTDARFSATTSRIGKKGPLSRGREGPRVMLRPLR